MNRCKQAKIVATLGPATSDKALVRAPVSYTHLTLPTTPYV